MREEVSVEQALNKGKKKLVFLPMVVLFSCIGVSFYFKSTQLIDGWIIIVGFVLGFLFSWLTWSYFVVEWKIWAFENVRNVNELKRKAIEQRLIWNEGSWFEKTEFKSYEQKQKLKQLEKKFLEKDVYHDDLNVPKETKIGYSKSNITIEFIVGIGMIGLGIYFFMNEKSGFFWVLLPLIGIYNLYSSLKKYFDKSPQIILNNFGVQLKKSELVSWDHIFNDRVYTVSSGKSSTDYFEFNDEKIAISNLDITFNKLENLLHVYRVRFEKNHPSES